MEKLEEVLISFRDVGVNTDYNEACDISMGKVSCAFKGLSCTKCILDYRAKLDKQINILNKLGE